MNIYVKRCKLMAAIIGVIIGFTMTAAVPFANALDSNLNLANALGAQNAIIAQLSTDWWEWSLSIPTSVNPLNGSGEGYCAVGQHGNTWFLGGTIDGSPVTRTCTITADKYILFPIINAECSVVEGNGTTPAALRSCAKDLINHVTMVESSVDGKEIKNLKTTRVQSPLYSFTLPQDNVLGIKSPTPNPSPSVSDGYWILLPPLSPGAHTIHFHGKAVFPTSTFEQNATYYLTVLP